MCIIITSIRLRYPFNTRLPHREHFCIVKVVRHAKSRPHLATIVVLGNSFRTSFVGLGWCVIKSALLCYGCYDYAARTFIDFFCSVVLLHSPPWTQQCRLSSFFLVSLFFIFFFCEAEICFYCHCVCAINYAILLFCHSFSKYWPRRVCPKRTAMAIAWTRWLVSGCA